MQDHPMGLIRGRDGRRRHEAWGNRNRTKEQDLTRISEKQQVLEVGLYSGEEWGGRS